MVSAGGHQMVACRQILSGPPDKEKKMKPDNIIRTGVVFFHRLLPIIILMGLEQFSDFYFYVALQKY